MPILMPYTVLISNASEKFKPIENVKSIYLIENTYVEGYSWRDMLIQTD